jgi:hypothetical protein
MMKLKDFIHIFLACFSMSSSDSSSMVPCFPLPLPTPSMEKTGGGEGAKVDLEDWGEMEAGNVGETTAWAWMGVAW